MIENITINVFDIYYTYIESIIKYYNYIKYMKINLVNN